MTAHADAAPGPARPDVQGPRATHTAALRLAVGQDPDGHEHAGGCVHPLPGLALRRTHDDDELGGTSVERGVERTLRQRRGRGVALPASVSETAGAELGVDLSAVRVHADSHADGLARSVRARAFTHGSDIYFKRGTYQPGSAGGQHLIAHELAHVAQQQTGLFRTPATSVPMIGRADDPAEAHADKLAHRLAPALRRQVARTRPQTGSRP